MNKIDMLINKISMADPLQNKHLKDCIDYLKEDEIADFENQLKYLFDRYSADMCAEGYIKLIHSAREERLNFIRTGKYRYSDFEETFKYVYSNTEYMDYYMLGLQLSCYLWSSHVDVHRFFKEKLCEFTGNFYLEIGPGHGQYFCEAINEGNFKKYTAIDVSETSLKNTNEYIKRNLMNHSADYDFINDDFLTHKFSCVFDCVCMGEVLEHVEEPLRMLQKIHDVTSDKANIYITVPANAPEIDHIYLFRSAEEIYGMAERAGFKIAGRLVALENKKMTYEKALKKKAAILVALHLTK